RGAGRGRWPVRRPARQLDRPARYRVGRAWRQMHHNGRVDPASDNLLDPAVAARLKRDDAGLICVVVQQHDTREVLMVGWMDDEALRRTLTSGRATYWSRSRGEYWRKGDTSGHVQL